MRKRPSSGSLLTATAEDRRARLLGLTAKGRRLIGRAFAEHARHLEDVMSVLDEQEKHYLYVGLKKLGRFVAATLDRPHSQTKDK